MAGRFRRFRSWIESIAYAGLKPDAPQARGRSMRWLPLWRPIERLLAGGQAPSDPFYLSNRTLLQRSRTALLIAVPCLVLAGAIVMALPKAHRVGTPPPMAEPSGAELAAKLLPNLEKTIELDKIAQPQDVDVAEIRVEHVGTVRLVGTLRNKTGSALHSVEVVFELTDAGGSQLGAVKVHVDSLAANGTAEFQLPIQQKEAAFALVREVHTS